LLPGLIRLVEAASGFYSSTLRTRSSPAVCPHLQLARPDLGILRKLSLCDISSVELTTIPKITTAEEASAALPNPSVPLPCVLTLASVANALMARDRSRRSCDTMPFPARNAEAPREWSICLTSPWSSSLKVATPCLGRLGSDSWLEGGKQLPRKRHTIHTYRCLRPWFPAEMRIARHDLYRSQSSSYISRATRCYPAWRSCEIKHRRLRPVLLASRGECSCRRPPRPPCAQLRLRNRPSPWQ
jgi:hypothetical protein